ncbi:MAG: hypothetical protein KGL11_04665 [Alphaproteobacteria bacterium]|nr:hypothetical protein [Alphaproteobacteria bacterium]
MTKPLSAIVAAAFVLTIAGCAASPDRTAGPVVASSSSARSDDPVADPSSDANHDRGDYGSWIVPIRLIN